MSRLKFFVLHRRQHGLLQAHTATTLALVGKPRFREWPQIFSSAKGVFDAAFVANAPAMRGGGRSPPWCDSLQTYAARVGRPAYSLQKPDLGRPPARTGLASPVLAETRRDARLYKQKPDLLKPDLCCEGKNKSNNAVRADRQDPDLAMAGKPKSGFGHGRGGKDRTC